MHVDLVLVKCYTQEEPRTLLTTTVKVNVKVSMPLLTIGWTSSVVTPAGATQKWPMKG